jgi:hypothetical protein
MNQRVEHRPTRRGCCVLEKSDGLEALIPGSTIDSPAH